MNVTIYYETGADFSSIESTLVEEGIKVKKVSDTDIHSITFEVLKENFDFLILVTSAQSCIKECEEIRRFSDIPILMVSSSDEKTRCIDIFKAGADDVVCKETTPDEVLHRMKAIWNRVTHRSIKKKNIVKYRCFTLDIENNFCTHKGIRLDLTNVELRLFYRLISKPRTVFTREDLMSECYPDGRHVSPRTIDSHIKKLRKKIQKAQQSGQESPIRSLYGVGYKIM